MCMIHLYVLIPKSENKTLLNATILPLNLYYWV